MEETRTDRRSDDRRHGDPYATPPQGRERRRGNRRNRIARAGLVAALTMLGARVHRTNLEPQFDPQSVGMGGFNTPDVELDEEQGVELDRAAINEIINEAAAEHGVNPELVRAVVQTESAFNPSAVSPVGAQGLMQVMPRTARSLGIVDPMDPRQNILGGTKYLSMLLERFNGNVALALAGYNAGPGNVAKYRGIPPFRETRGYVSKIRNIFAQATGETFAIPAAARPAHRRARRSSVRLVSSRGKGRSAASRSVSSKATTARSVKARPARTVKSAAARGRTSKVSAKSKVTVKRTTAPRRTTARRR